MVADFKTWLITLTLMTMVGCSIYVGWLQGFDAGKNAMQRTAVDVGAAKFIIVTQKYDRVETYFLFNNHSVLLIPSGQVLENVVTNCR